MKSGLNLVKSGKLDVIVSPSVKTAKSGIVAKNKRKANTTIAIILKMSIALLALLFSVCSDMKREDRKKTIDSIAASYILESYLSKEKQRNKKAEEKAIMNKEFNEEIYEDEEDRIFELEADDGSVERLYHIATIEYKGGMYCIFQKAEPETEEEEDEVVIFALVGEGDDAVLNPIEDEQLLDEVFAEFCHQYEEFENSEDAMKLEQ